MAFRHIYLRRDGETCTRRLSSCSGSKTELKHRHREGRDLFLHLPEMRKNESKKQNTVTGSHQGLRNALADRAGPAAVLLFIVHTWEPLMAMRPVPHQPSNSAHVTAAQGGVALFPSSNRRTISATSHLRFFFFSFFSFTLQKHMRGEFKLSFFSLQGGSADKTPINVLTAN